MSIQRTFNVGSKDFHVDSKDFQMGSKDFHVDSKNFHVDSKDLSFRFKGLFKGAQRGECSKPSRLSILFRSFEISISPLSRRTWVVGVGPEIFLEHVTIKTFV